MDDPRWLTDSEMRAWLGYRRMRLLMDARIDRDLSVNSGLSARDYDVMSHLSASPGDRLRFSQLGEDLRWSRSRLSHHLSRMETRELVRRQDDPGDGRGSWIELTEAGRRKLVDAAADHVASVREHLFDRLTPTQVTVLGEIADAVLEPLSDRLSRPVRRGADAVVAPAAVTHHRLLGFEVLRHDADPPHSIPGTPRRPIPFGGRSPRGRP